MGKNLVYVPQCHSTNTLASSLSQRADTPEGTVVITDDQTAGRGQRGNTWHSEPGMNLTFSVVLRPAFLDARAQFQISRAVALAIHDFVRDLCPGSAAAIKWPNDIMIGERKAAGILIENHISGNAIGASVAGIGININQLTLPSPNAISLRGITGQTYDLSLAFSALMDRLETRYLQLRSGSLQDLEAAYHERLYRKDAVHRFAASGSEWEGVITGVDTEGRLVVRRSSGAEAFGVREIAFL